MFEKEFLGRIRIDPGVGHNKNVLGRPGGKKILVGVSPIILGRHLDTGRVFVLGRKLRKLLQITRIAKQVFNLLPKPQKWACYKF